MARWMEAFWDAGEQTFDFPNEAEHLDDNSHNCQSLGGSFDILDILVKEKKIT